MMLIQHHKASEYHDRACDQFDQLYADAATRHESWPCRPPYIMGAPHHLNMSSASPNPAAPGVCSDRRADPRLVPAQRR
jgi:hypothetical protein